MNATIFCLSPEVRDAALDLKAFRRKVKDSGDRGYQWRPGEAYARQRLVNLSLKHGADRERLRGQQNPPPRPGEGFLKLA